MDTQSNVTMTLETIERQEQYVREQKEKGGLGIVFADAFLRGMRDLGYKNPAWALAEMVDNSFQAAADVVSIRFGFGTSKAKPKLLAICDNGNGMIPEMISFSVRWGGTDREGDRHGLGRYGYGLPSAAVSLAKRYTVYSRIKGGKWHSVTVDIDELAAAASDQEKTKILLAPVEASLPAWLLSGPGQEDKLDLATMESGTIVVLEDLDRLSRLSGWITVEKLRTKLLQHFGVIYRYWLPERRICVDGAATQVVDPLFLMEHGRFFDETSVRAERVETRTFTVTTPRSTTGKVTIRASVLPPNFQLVRPEDYSPNGREGGARGLKLNNRHPIMREYNGLLICREQRQIDTISPRGTKFQNYDANIKVEIDFDPELDEFFGITTAKQQIVIDDQMWEKLTQEGKDCGGLKNLIKDLRGRFVELQKELAAKYEPGPAEETPRASAVAMEESSRFKPTTAPPTPLQRAEAERNLEEKAIERAEAAGVAKEQMVETLRAETAKKHWEVEFVAIPEGPFYRPTRLGEQKRLLINTDHAFYTKVFGPSTPDGKAALEVLLFVLAERELEARNDAETFYKVERQQWSVRLRHALDALVADESLTDRAASMAEQLHETLDEEVAAE